MSQNLPVAIAATIADAGYPDLYPVADGWVAAEPMAGKGGLRVRCLPDGSVLVALPESDAFAIGLTDAGAPLPVGMTDLGVAHSRDHLHQALSVLRVLQANPLPLLERRIDSLLAWAGILMPGNGHAARSAKGFSTNWCMISGTGVAQ